ncbi:MAG: hypothetical protein JEZ08_07525 [Clostridiales bacterium]|nr:hypothetical protein [Clostridiales bacterium]
MNKPPYAPPNVDYYINDIFICRGMRKKGIALKALKILFEEFHGICIIRVKEESKRR